MTKRNCKPNQTANAILARRLTQGEFIRRSILKHGDDYDYSKVVYVNCSTNVEIICKKCERSFYQLPPNHWKGYRCTHCYAKRSYTTEQFIAKASITHGSRYDYSQARYINNRVKVKIICYLHGVFEQSPANHMKGSGCPDCAQIARAKKSTIAVADFLKIASEKHSRNYKYDLASYVNTDSIIKIKCSKHGWFKQNAKAHMHGRGCRECSFESSGYNRSRFKAVCNKNNNGNGLLYVIHCKERGESFYKIGITSRTVQKRFMSKGHLPYDFTELYVIEGEAAYIYDLENKIHILLKEHHYSPKIDFKGSVYECFTQITKPVEKLLKQLDSTKQLQLLA